MRVLVAVDGSEYSAAAVDEVAKLQWPADTEICLLCAAEEFRYPAYDAWLLPGKYHAEVMEASRLNANRIVTEHERVLRERIVGAVTVTTDIVEGDPKSVIIDAAAQWPADLVVIGSHGYSALPRLLLGSVSTAVANHVHCSVWIVRRALGE
jgi:nucleotide-binding universal stress UspA family protein